MDLSLLGQIIPFFRELPIPWRDPHRAQLSLTLLQSKPDGGRVAGTALLPGGHFQTHCLSAWAPRISTPIHLAHHEPCLKRLSRPLSWA